MTVKSASLSALAILCAWDILRPHERTRRNPRHRRHHRIYRLRINGKFYNFPNYRSLVEFQTLQKLQQQYEASAVYAPTTKPDQPLGTETPAPANQPQPPGTEHGDLHRAGLFNKKEEGWTGL